MRPSRLAALTLLALSLGWSGQALAGWFERDNAIAYDLSRQGHDRRALHYWDHSAKGLYGRGTALMHLGRVREAEQAFRQALALAPHKTGFSDQLEMPAKRRPHFMASVWYNLGNALYAQNELAEARDAWLRALGFESGHAKARHNLAIVDRLLNARKRQAPPPPAGPSGGKKRKPGKSGSQAASPPQRQRQRHAPLHLPGHAHQTQAVQGAGKRQAGERHAGAGGNGKQSTHHTPSMHRGTGSGHASGDQDQRRQSDRSRGMSRQQAVQQLRLVEEGVSVFLRHRLGEKGHGASTNGGKPW